MPSPCVFFVVIFHNIQILVRVTSVCGLFRGGDFQKSNQLSYWVYFPLNLFSYL